MIVVNTAYHINKQTVTSYRVVAIVNPYMVGHLQDYIIWLSMETDRINESIIIKRRYLI